MRLLLVLLLSLQEVQNKLKVHQGHLPIGSTLARKGLQIDDVLRLQTNPGPRHLPVMDAAGPINSRGKGLHLQIQARSGCIFQVRVLPPSTVACLKQNVSKAIHGSPARFKLLFQKEVLYDPDPLTEYDISEGDILLISPQP